MSGSMDSHQEAGVSIWHIDPNSLPGDFPSTFYQYGLLVSFITGEGYKFGFEIYAASNNTYHIRFLVNASWIAWKEIAVS